MKRLEGRNAIVTGASSGIGRAIAIRFAEEGANVAINCRKDREEGLEVQQEALKRAVPGAKIIIAVADVSREEEIHRLFAESISTFGSLDILVNNAGIQAACPSHELSSADFDRVLNVNLRGAFLCAREALRHFVARNVKGVILNNSSVHEQIPKPKYLSYSVSKGGLRNLTRTLALEYADRGIRVNAVGPGATVTAINDAWIHDPERRAAVESHIPLGRAATPEEIAGVFAFLASDEAAYITGQTVFAGGGLTLYPEFRTTWASGE